MYNVPCFRHNSGVTSNRKVHHPAIESLVLSPQCDKATAVFVSSRDRDFVTQVGRCGSRLLDLLSLVLQLWPKCFFSCSSIDEQYSYVRVLKKKSRTILTFFLALQQSNTVFFVHISLFFEARLKPIAAPATKVHHPGIPSLSVYTNAR